ncbi:MAG: hypothetical protein JXA00_03335 [Candidatus Thermoplasmatota archaeon]|nr:hypothetical protein [Candidatus Thermoplasmatota archaeon]
MKKRLVVVSCTAAVVLILASISSVIGWNTSPGEHTEDTIQSPLFSVRTSRSTGHHLDTSVHTMYLGKGETSPLFFGRLSSTQSLIERGLQLLRISPGIIEKNLRNALRNPQIQCTLQEQGLSEQQVIAYFNQVKHTPELLAGEMGAIEESIQVPGGFQPAQLLNTSSGLGCVITIIVLLPVFLVLSILIATMTLVTCLNINNCFENLFNSMIQGLS